MANVAVLRLPADGRMACVGKTGGGKSFFAKQMFLGHRGRRVVIDPHDSEETEGSWPTTDQTIINFSTSQTWRVVPKDPLDLDFYDRIYKNLFEAGNCLIWCDEANAVTTSHKIPLGVRMVLYQGRKKKVSHIAASPRPVDVHPGIWAQSELWAIFRMINADDRKTVANHAGVPIEEFEGFHRRLGKHGFIWWDSTKDQMVVIAEGLKLKRDKAAS